MKEILKLTMAQLRSQRMLTVLGVAGTALSIFLIMVVVMIHQVKVLPFAPESCRERLLHLKHASFVSETGSASGQMSYSTARTLTEGLNSAEEVSVFQCGCTNEFVSLAGGKKEKVEMRGVDAGFWKIFDFAFIHGKPFGKEAVESALPVAVVSAGTALHLFGTKDAVGREFKYGRNTYRVSGVVKDVSTLADCAYSQVWVPLTTTPSAENGWLDGLMGDFSAVILARSSDDFSAIREEFEANVRRLNDNTKAAEWSYEQLSRPYVQYMHAEDEWSNLEPDPTEHERTRMLVYLVLLIVPAINLSGMTESRLRQRAAEIGVRRAFGSTRRAMFGQLIGESLVITLAAGIIGWVLSMVFARIMSAELFTETMEVSTSAPTVSPDMLVQWSVFFTALLFCFILNLLSNSLPAWRASRSNIVKSLNGQ